MLERILNAGIIAVVRCHDATHVVSAIEALAAGGVIASEITLTVPDALEVLKSAKAKLGERVILGVGTVLTAGQANEAIDAGADFVVSPILDEDIIQLCKARETVVMPGCFTPTEIHRAWDAGADVIKVFPAECVGPAFFKAVHGPLPHVRLMPTGGVDLTTARSFLDAGADCLGVGSQLVDPKLVTSQDWPTLTSKAAAFAKIVADHRSRSILP